MHDYIKLNTKPALITFLLSAFLLCNSAMALEPLDSIAVVVNDDVITKRELEEKVDYFANQIRLSNGTVSDMDSLRKQVLERMIRDKIQLQQAAQLGIQVDDISLNRMIDAMAKKNNLTLSELRTTLTKEGIDFADFRSQTRDELIIQELQKRMVADKVNVTSQEIRQFIESNTQQDNSATEYHLYHILIATPESAGPEDIQVAQQKADAIYQQLQQGTDFKQLAVQESDGSNALNGGDLGIRKANELPELFLNAIADLDQGDISQPVRSASGFHLLQLASASSNVEMVTQTHARHILIRTSADISDEDARQTLAELKQRIEDGEDFSDLANEYSDDPGSKIQGGDLGWANPGTFVPEFERVMGSLTEGQISEPFKSQFGWHILQVLERREHDMGKTMLEAKAMQSIRARKIDEELRLWLRRIRDEAYVEYVDESLNPDDQQSE
jgi:peptidyl-prolyl cis-trans isomerase SurA